MLAGALMVCLAAAPPQATPAAFDFRVDPRVELLSLVFRLAGDDVYNQRNSRSPYADAVEAHFAPFRDHPVVARAIRLRDVGIGYDAPMSLAVHLTDGQPFRLRSTRTLDDRWQPAERDAFLTDLNDFVIRSGFTAFFEEQRASYAAAAGRLRDALAEPGYLSWFDSFFGRRPVAKYRVVVAMLNGGSCYGPRAALEDGTEEIYAILGASKFDDAGVPTFGEFYSDFLIHELTHSYTNDLLVPHSARLQPTADALYEPFRKLFEGQGYGDGSTILRESLVRASVAECQRSLRGPDAAARVLKEQDDRGFLWVPGLARLLRTYSESRSAYADFAAFVPQIVSFFETYGRETWPQVLARMPRAVSIDPSNGATDVDPETSVIKVVFDRRMSGAYAVVGGGERYPGGAGQSSFDATRTAFTMPVRLRPNWSYELWLNRGRFSAFRSEEGLPLQPVHVTFQTRP